MGMDHGRIEEPTRSNNVAYGGSIEIKPPMSVDYVELERLTGHHQNHNDMGTWKSHDTFKVVLAWWECHLSCSMGLVFCPLFMNFMQRECRYLACHLYKAT